MNYFYITGTSKGIGKAIAEELLKDSVNTVIGISRNQTVHSKNYIHHSLDLSATDKVAAFDFQEHPGAGQIVLINNAATLGEVEHAGNLKSDTIAKAFNINITAPAILMNAFIRKYQSHAARKLIINITSGAAQSAYDGWSVYCASKAAIDMLSKVAAAEQELSQSGIRVLAIAPGVVDTDMQKSIRNSDEKGFSRKEKFIDLHRNKRLYSPEDVAREFVQLIKHPEKITNVIHRIVL